MNRGCRFADSSLETGNGNNHVRIKLGTVLIFTHTISNIWIFDKLSTYLFEYLLFYIFSYLHTHNVKILPTQVEA